MKKLPLFVIIFLLQFALLAGCKQTDYSLNISDERSDLFCAETEEFSVLVSCIERERPFLADGIVSPRVKTVEAVLTEKTLSGKEYEIYFLEDVPRGGEMSFRNVSGDYYYSRGVDVFPSGSVSLRIISGSETIELAATSVKSADTLTTKEALDHALSAEKETIARMSEGGFRGEFHVRLLRRDKTYYYVGIIDTQGHTVSLLLDSETGDVLARRET